jgi:hypothetical protein
MELSAFPFSSTSARVKDRSRQFGGAGSDAGLPAGSCESRARAPEVGRFGPGPARDSETLELSG